MKNKIIYSLILLLFVLCIFHLKTQLKSIEENLKEKENQINSIFQKNKANIEDLINRNEELVIKNEELKEYQKQLEIINDDCLNRSVNSNVIKLLQEAGI
ncbi:MAG TPA: hypothetical protein VLL98_03455 [Rickettsiales bacterium]|nr:hypothetical protein [Rickettsiales bacterium]